MPNSFDHDVNQILIAKQRNDAAKAAETERQRIASETQQAQAASLRNQAQITWNGLKGELEQLISSYNSKEHETGIRINFLEQAAHGWLPVYRLNILLRSRILEVDIYLRIDQTNRAYYKIEDKRGRHNASLQSQEKQIMNGVSEIRKIVSDSVLQMLGIGT